MPKYSKCFFFFALVLVSSVATAAEWRPATRELPPDLRGEVSVRDEWDCINQLIALTEQNLESQRALRALIAEYRQEQLAFLQGDKTAKRLRQLSQLARQVQHGIQEAHLEELFGSHFMEEISLLSTVGQGRAR